MRDIKQDAVKDMLLAGMSIGCICILYFLLLVMHAPLFFIVIAILISIGGLVFLYRRSIVEGYSSAGYISSRSFIILCCGLIFAGYNIYSLATRHGGWDAYMMWNYHARLMADPQHWKLIFRTTANDHIDYPLGLPGICALFIRLCNDRYYVFIPFVVSVFITLSVVALVFTALARSAFLIAVIALFLLVTDSYFIQFGISQYADTLLAFFFLCALISKEYAWGDKRYIAMSTFFLGCCPWIKNEGEVLAAIFVLFNVRFFFTKEHLRYTALGLVAPLITLIIFKTCYPATNDMVGHLGKMIYEQALYADRYRVIYSYFIHYLNERFYYIKIIFITYAVLCILTRKMPSRNICMLLTCLICYLLFYVFTHLDLEWHLRTSLDRLMHQLMPAIYYTLLFEIASIAKKWFGYHTLS